mgnify:CR=1 FL=1
MVGAILTIAGYSINDTIVVFDRIREGLKHRERGSIQSLMNTSINETLGRTILTGGTTLLSVGALYFFGGAVLRDFSFAILVGILVGTYSSIYIAAPDRALVVQTARQEHPARSPRSRSDEPGIRQTSKA